MYQKKESVKPLAKALNDELAGFVPFVPTQQSEDVIGIRFTHSYARLSRKALIELGMPERIGIFFDYNRKRLMMTAAEERHANAVTISPMPKTKNRLVICIPSLMKEIRMIAGLDHLYGCWVNGHKTNAERPALIFDLTKIEKREKRSTSATPSACTCFRNRSGWETADGGRDADQREADGRTAGGE